MADIAFDAATDGGTVTSTTLSWSHVCAASAVLLVAVGTYNQPSTPTVTYNGVALSLVNNTNTTGDGNDRHYVFALNAPATGSNTVLVTLAGSAQMWAHSESYVNASRSQTFGTSSTNAPVAGPASFSPSLTTVVDRSLVYLAANGYHNAPLMLSDVQQLRSGTMTTGNSGAVVTPAGSYSFIVGDSSSEANTQILVAIEPAAIAFVVTVRGPFPTYRPDLV